MKMTEKGFSTLEDLVSYLEKNKYIKSEKIKKAFLEVDRKKFIPPHLERYAYLDIPLPLGYGATISQPSIIAQMLEALELEEGMKVLEIGSGSGYVCALLSKIVGDKGKVYGVEMIPELAEFSKNVLKSLNIENVEIVVGDGSIGLPDKSPFDRIIASAAFPETPYHLLDQLEDGGIIVTPVGDSTLLQKLIKIIKYNKEEIKEEDLGPVLFVPMRGKYGRIS